MSESFCERTLRAAGHIVNEGNSLLNKEEVEMLTILRVNREYMEHMRANYADVVTQKFKMTLVQEDPSVTPASASGAASSSAGAASSTYAKVTEI